MELNEDELLEEEQFQSTKDTGKGKEKIAECFEENLGGSDDNESLNDSDEEVVVDRTFNPATDFNRAVVLEEGLRFTSVDVLRRALKVHDVENRYDFYYLHNGRSKVTVYCKYKCKCPWDAARGKIRCVCNKSTCPFRLYATSLKNQELIVIRTMNLDHHCSFKGKTTKKLTSEYLADRFLEDWRENSSCKLRDFRKTVHRTMGIKIKYDQAWVARGRAKLLINGNADEAFAMV